MSSQRLPGKVLMPLRGKPILCHVYERVSQVIHSSLVAVLTSTEESDDPIAAYCRWQGWCVYRGSLNDVYSRFRSAVTSVFPCDYFVRICADSPFINPETIKTLILKAKESGWEADLVSTVWPKMTFPKGCNAELVKTSTFLAIYPSWPSESEDVTLYFYNNHKDFHLIGVENPEGNQGGMSFAVDRLGDWERLNESSGD